MQTWIHIRDCEYKTRNSRLFGRNCILLNKIRFQIDMHFFKEFHLIKDLILRLYMTSQAREYMISSTMSSQALSIASYNGTAWLAFIYIQRVSKYYLWYNQLYIVLCWHLERCKYRPLYVIQLILAFSSWRCKLHLREEKSDDFQSMVDQVGGV